jgi:hypothetical protein
MGIAIRCSKDGKLYAEDEVEQLNGKMIAKQNLTKKEKEAVKKQKEENAAYDPDEPGVEQNEVNQNKAKDDSDEEEVEEDDSDDDADEGDKYDKIDYKELQKKAGDRENVKGNLPEDELRDAMRADDKEE